MSKILWFFADPGNVLLMGLIASAFLFGWRRFRRLGQWLFGLCVTAAVVLTVVPVGDWMFTSLENRFAKPAQLPSVDGIIVLGGVVSPVLSAKRQTPSYTDGIERITESATLARQHPSARIIYSGGSGSLTQTEFREADYVSQLYGELGIRGERLTLDRDARNTAENASIVYRLMQPKPDETWVLVTSAFHMPRAIGAFRRIGWNVTPYPVDYSTFPDAGYRPPLSLTGGLSKFSRGLHEWIGLTAYWLTGRTTSLFPRPLPSEAI